jgi:hypothetical protein
MKSIREYINILESINTSHGTTYLTVENWYVPQDPEDENFPAEIELKIDYEIYGRDIPARIRYDDYDHPAEYAEIDDYKVYDANTNQLITNIPDAIVSEIEDAIMQDYRNPPQDYEPPYDDDYR